MKILSVLLEITLDLATRAIKTPLSSPIGTMWCLCDPTPSGWCKTDAHSTDFGPNQGESLSEAWTRFKDLLQKVPHHGIDLWHQVQIFYDYVNPATRRTIDQSVGALGWNLEEIHMTWAHLEKKRTRLQLYTKADEEIAHRLWRRRQNTGRRRQNIKATSSRFL
ncbi:hypothetical protein Tco_1165440 [Tanacetum coccineum]